MSTAEEFKAKGNAALQSGNTSEAVEYYTKAINADGSNHVYFSNRSAAYLKMNDPNNALEDANSCLGLNPNFPKGYSRKGAALHALKRYNDSIAAYKEGLEKFPNDAGIKNGLADVEREKDAPPTTAGGGGGGLGGLFSPQMMAQMALNPKLRPYLNDSEVMGKIRMAQQNPNMASMVLQDPKIMEMFGLMMGGAVGDEYDDNASSDPFPTSDGGGGGGTTSAASDSTPSSSSNKTNPETTDASKSTPSKAAEPAATAEEYMEVEEDLSDLPPAERKLKEDQRAAKKKKEVGNELYKQKKFEEALAAYDEAIALDPASMTFLSNKAAVYFTQSKFDECIEQCLKAVEVGKENRASFEDRAKALTRAAKAYQKKGDLEKAIEMCNKAQLESFDKNTQRLLKTMELEMKKAKAKAYLDDDKAEEAKQRGNEHFREKKWAEAVKEYEEAVKRAPKNAAIRNNLSAALCKIMDFSGAQRQIEEALEIDPKYVKAWARKGDIEMVMKEHHKARESYQKGLELDPENAACRDGLRKCLEAINFGRRNMTDAEKKEQAAHAMADPEIQAILQDPVIQQVLRDFGENQNAAQQAMRDQTVRAKIEKLIAAGVIETG